MTAGSLLRQRGPVRVAGVPSAEAAAGQDPPCAPEAKGSGCLFGSPEEPRPTAVRPASQPAGQPPSTELAGAAAPRALAARPQQRLCRFRPPTIDCSLAVASDAASNPFANADCHRISDRFEVFESLGQGTSAVVYRARQLSSGSEVALKVLRIRDEELLRIAREEYELLRSVEHPHIVHALDFFTFSQGAVLVLDYFKGSSLEAAVLALPERHLQEHVSQRLFAALLRAVEHLHITMGIIHRDVKAANVLVDAGLTDLKLVDFNTARRMLDGALTMTGTADYLPPEVLLGAAHSPASDVWASGLCLHFMLAGSLPLQRRRFVSHEEFGQAARLHSAVQCSGPEWEPLSAPCKDVVRRCLAPEQVERPTASELLECAWLSTEHNVQTTP